MKRLYNIIGIAVMCVVMLAPARAVAADAKTTAEACWKEGISSYERREYSEAVRCFEQIAELGYASADLYYNLANSYFKLGEQRAQEGERKFAGGELGAAVLNYHRALRLDPTMDDARYNLELAVDYTNDTEPLPESFIGTIWRGARDVATSNGWAVSSLILLGMVLCLVIFYLLSNNIALRKFSFFVAILLVVGFIFSMTFALSSRSEVERDNRAVVVCSDTTPVHASPESGSKVIRQPSQGVTVRELRIHGEWSEILFADGEKGWIRSAKLEHI